MINNFRFLSYYDLVFLKLMGFSPIQFSANIRSVSLREKSIVFLTFFILSQRNVK